MSTCDADSDPLQPDSSRGPGSVHTELKGAERDSDAGGGGGGGGDAGSHGVFLTLKDHDHIRLFVQEFTFRGLLPHIEKNIRQLNDQVGVRTSRVEGDVSNYTQGRTNEEHRSPQALNSKSTHV